MRGTPPTLIRWWHQVRRRHPSRTERAVASDIREEMRVLERWARRSDRRGAR